MAEYGITENGFNGKTLEEAKLEMESLFKAEYGLDFALNPEEPAGQIIGIVAERESEIWEKFEDAVNQTNINTAIGIYLDIIGALSLTKRKSADESIISKQIFIGDSGTIVPTDTVIFVENDPTKEYKTESEVTLGTGIDAVISISKYYLSGTFRLVIDSETSGIIDFSDDESTITEIINNMLKFEEITVDLTNIDNIVITLGKVEIESAYIVNIDTIGGSAVAIITNNGEYQGFTTCIATEAKYQIANSLSVTEFQNPITGITRTFNSVDSTEGSNIESDEDFRVSIKKDLSSGKATLNAIRNDLLEISGVTDAWVVENDKEVSDSVGRPPNSIEAYVYQINKQVGDEQLIIDSLGDSKGAGIQIVGDIVGNYVDVQGISHEMRYSEPTTKEIYLELTLTKTSEYPTNGDITLKDNLVTWGNALGPGKDIIVYPSLMIPINSVTGISDVLVKIGTTPNPTTDDNIEIGDGISDIVQISTWDTSRITILEA